MIEHRLTLHSAQHYGKRVPPDALGHVLAAIPQTVRQTIAMRMAGRSSLDGRRNGWLDRAADIRFIDHYGDDETTLVFEAPTLGETAEEIYKQPDMFKPFPEPSDTGFDLLGDLFNQVRSKDSESDAFDGALLRNVGRLGSRFSKKFESADLWGNRFKEKKPVVLDETVISAAHELENRTPKPSRVRISGVLDMVRASTMGFGLKLMDGQEVRGTLREGDLAALTKFLQHRQEIVVVGVAVFRPSGRLLRIDGDTILPASDADRFFSSVPVPNESSMSLRSIVAGQKEKKGIRSIIGKWPGEEDDETVLRALAEVS